MKQPPLPGVLRARLERELLDEDTTHGAPPAPDDLDAQLRAAYERGYRRGWNDRARSLRR